MMPIRSLLSRIRWDQEYAKAEFVIGYYDRRADALRLVPIDHVFQELGDHFFVRIIDEDGQSHPVPLHRIKVVFRNGELIWKRQR